MTEEEEKLQKPDSFLLLFTFVAFLVIGFAFYNLFFQKNYDFIVETACDPSVEICFYRPCDIDENECYPNNLSYYKEYTIKARDFKYCENEDCGKVCREGTIECVESICSEQDLISCVEGLEPVLEEDSTVEDTSSQTENLENNAEEKVTENIQ
jgi:hypothetical protein